MEIDRREHWEQVHEQKEPEQRSWFEAQPAASLELIDRAALPSAARVIDVGGGTTRLAERLLDRGFRPTILDIAEAALQEAKERLGDRAGSVEWIRADVTEASLEGPFDLWHDRAVFHFLTEAADRRRYVEAVRAAVPAGGHLVIATFAEDGPIRCSGLPTMRYDAAGLLARLGPGFDLRETRVVEHPTPGGSTQRFRYNLIARTRGSQPSVAPERPTSALSPFSRSNHE